MNENINIKDFDIKAINKLVADNNGSLCIFLFNDTLNIYECNIIYSDNKTEIQDIILLDKLSADKSNIFMKNKKSLEYLFNAYYSKNEIDLLLIIENDKIFGINNKSVILTKKYKIGFFGIMGLVNKLIL